ncbi:MAG: zf-HC2 domain-containing protein [Ignavibacteria bacterium]
MEGKFLDTYTEILSGKAEHLSFELISTYINFHGLLSRKEKKFFEDHLQECTSCRDKFNDTYDEEFEFDDAKISTVLNPESSIFKSDFNYSSSDETIRAIFRPETDINVTVWDKQEPGFQQYYLVFNRIQKDGKDQNLRIIVPESDVVLRIISPIANKKYKLPTAWKLDISSIKALQVEIITRHYEEPEKKVVHRKTNFIPIIKYAALILVLFGASIGLYMLLVPSDDVDQFIDENLRKSSPENTAVSSDSLSSMNKDKQQKKNQTAAKDLASYNSNKQLESTIDRDPGKKIKIISPLMGDTVKKHLEFEWTSLPGLNEYTLTILDNKNEEIWKRTLTDTKVDILQKLKPGRYYWNIEVNGETEATGKFYIK